MSVKAGEILSKARERKGWTQADAADKLGISAKQYGKYEQGAFPKFKREAVQKIEEVFGIQIQALIYEQNVPVGNGESWNNGNGTPSDTPDWRTVVELQKQIIALQSKENSSLQEELIVVKETIREINGKVANCTSLINQNNELSRESNRLASEANKFLKSLEGLAELAKVARDQDPSERKDFPPYVKKDRSRAKK